MPIQPEYQGHRHFSFVYRRTILKFLFVVLAVLPLSDHNSTVSASESAVVKLTEENCPVVWAVYNGFAKGDLEAVLSLMSSKVRWWHPGNRAQIPFAGEFTGPEGVQQFFEIVMSNLENLGQEIDDCISRDNQVAVFGHESYRVKPTGKEYFTRWVHLYTVENAQIVAFEEFADTAAIAAAFQKD